jgi:xanthine dehydrogenase accessory factor
MKILDELTFLFTTLSAGEDLVLATVVQTWGSSPRPVGSHLVINREGQFQGSVSGGCIEGAVIGEALDIIGTKQNKLLSFSVSNEQAWDVGLACGGQINIMLQGLCAADQLHQNLFSQLQQAIEKRRGCVLIFNPANALLSLIDSQQFNLMAGENSLVASQDESLQNMVISGKSGYLNDDSYFVRPFLPDYKLYIIGAVHIAQKLAPMAMLANYDVTVIDPRGGFADPLRFDKNNALYSIKLVNDWPDEFFEQHPLDNQCAVVTLSHDPKIDDPALVSALSSKAFYIGALGSKKTHGQRVERLTEEGLGSELHRICAPIGIKLGGRAPQDIAISIIAQITQYRYQD